LVFPGGLAFGSWPGRRGGGWLPVVSSFPPSLALRVSAVRASEQAAALVHWMRHADLSRVIVTRPDGTLAGLSSPKTWRRP